jgi:hypothetical protein
LSTDHKMFPIPAVFPPAVFPRFHLGVGARFCALPEFPDPQAENGNPASPQIRLG